MFAEIHTSRINLLTVYGNATTIYSSIFVALELSSDISQPAEQKRAPKGLPVATPKVLLCFHNMSAYRFTTLTSCYQNGAITIKHSPMWHTTLACT